MKNPFHCFVCTLNVTTLSLVIVLSYTLTVTALKSADIRNHLGTRTPYRYKFNKDDSRISFPNCKDTKIWMVLRHGTRLPSAKDIVRMNTTLKDLRMDIILHNRKGKGTLNYEQLHWFENWDSDIPLGQEKYLVLEGQDEMILIAERMQKRFPNAIQNKYNNSTFMFRYTATQRTQQSARYFTVGLFDKKHSQHVYFEPVLKVDTTLRFYKHCDRWQKQVKKNPDTFKEVSLFGQSKEMNDTLLSVSKRLGLDRALTLDEVILMYRVCGYEISWHKYTTSPWCFGFDEKSIKVLEYYDDLKKYWVDGYAHSQQAACMVMKNMFDSMSKRGRNATFLFSHSGTILKLLTHLQLYKPDGPLRGDAIVENRPWRMSNIDCFASNIAFVLFKCKDGDKILTLHQEKVIKLPMCSRELCPLAELKEHFHNTIHNCNFTDLCSVD
ncbi:multiple inositol polyphosphate phosphatase 1-like isoform X3 [Maniola hyperantus]|uniref:multiple inositol polyphosphate phosphatase 1-like isoform X3 n=1 Tax=Aphantopus hyperantus TaxID=2795564 RepID=UPI001569653A|nr:multiple inositol polyphosphate phosphatase 1-like [Maniola hyperantus]